MIFRYALWCILTLALRVTGNPSNVRLTAMVKSSGWHVGSRHLSASVTAWFPDRLSAAALAWSQTEMGLGLGARCCSYSWGPRDATLNSVERQWCWSCSKFSPPRHCPCVCNSPECVIFRGAVTPGNYIRFNVCVTLERKTLMYQCVTCLLLCRRLWWMQK